MKRIIDYTLGWDINDKKGYLAALDEDHITHSFGGLSKKEFKILQDLLKEDKVFIDNNQWVIGGWAEFKAKSGHK